MAIKKKISSFGLVLVLAMLFSTVSPVRAFAATALVPVGQTVGIEMSTDGLLVAGLSQISTEAGECCPASDCGIQPGDIVVRLGATEITTAEDFTRAAAELDGSDVALTLKRGDKLIQYTIKPAQNTDGSWRLGLWLRDGISGIGTVTFYDPETGLFGALGHSISDVDTGVLLPIGDGHITGASITGVRKGESGAAGELQGAFDLEDKLGVIELNTIYGIFGVMDSAPEGEALPVAESNEIANGAATILANVSGDETREYSVEIATSGKPSEGRLTVRITDPALLATTGGIVQGMSGCPIIQNGKLVGAVTHVLLSDSTRGYGITINAMLDAVSRESAKADAA